MPPTTPTVDIRSILDPLKVPKELKAQAWDAFHKSRNEGEFRLAFDKMLLPRGTKAALFDAKGFTPDQKIGGREAPVPEQPRSVGGFLQNALSSGGRFVGDIAQAVTSPVQTTKAVASLGAGAVEKLIPGEQGHEGSVDALVDLYVERYGGIENLKKTLYEDPVGVLADLATVAGGAGAAAKGLQVAGKAAGLTRTAATAGKVARVAGTVSRVVDPAQAITRPAGYLAKKTKIGAELANPADMYQSALKPPPASNNTAAVARMVQTGLDSRIPVNKAGIQKLADLVEDLQLKVEGVIASDPTRPISPGRVAQRVNETAQTFKTQATPRQDLAAIGAAKKEFLTEHSVPVRIPVGTKQPIGFTGQAKTAFRTVRKEVPIRAEDAQEIKKGTYRQLKSKSYGELKTARIEAEKALARGLKEELANAFPELAALNDKESRLLQLEPVLERAVRRINNHQLFGLGTPAAASGVYAATGSTKLALALGTIRAVLDNPTTKSKIAIALHQAQRLRPKMKIPRTATTATRIQQYVESLGEFAPAAP
jgi:hypothetical protein